MNRFKTIVFLLIFPLLIQAQDFDLGIGIGTTAYAGDIAPNTGRFSTGENHPSFSIFARMPFSRFMAVRANLLLGKISASDANSSIPELRARNLSFQSGITELGAMLEINPLGNNRSLQKFQPYVYGGIAFFRFNPRTNYQGNLVALQPLGTEGQGMTGFGDKYKLNQWAVPLGFGMTYALTENIKLGVDFGLRKTFTDYLDDVSGTYVNYNDLRVGNGATAAALGNRQGELTGEPVAVPTGTVRGNSNNKDWYYNAGLTLSYTFMDHRYRRKHAKKNLGCPAVH